jgi:hypothetical protein
VYTVDHVRPFGDALTVSAPAAAGAAADMFVPGNPFGREEKLALGVFGRFPSTRRGFFLAIANPFGAYGTALAGKAGAALSASYAPNLLHRASTMFGEHYVSEPGVLGLTTLSQYWVDGGGGGAVNTGERLAYRDCVRSFLLDLPSRKKKGSVKVNVAWDESDYQIDVGTAAGVTEYKRIIDRNSQLGVTHVVYEPGNTRYADRHNSTDGWGWEASLWFSMGERIREGVWSPVSSEDAVPQDILDMVAYAASKNVELLAYVYPCLAFAEHAEAVIGNALDLSAPGVAEWMAGSLVGFMAKTGAGGFAWDHDIFAGDASKRYAQWRSWMNILAVLRARFPDIVMDHRQTNHMWGPWYQLAGSYAEPLAGDENPESYGVAIANLHTDKVTADHLRSINWKYAMGQFLPVERVPGFTFHQTERTDDNGTNPCFGSERKCYDDNTRDADLLGYKYSLMSNLATAPANLVFAMIPARDEDEFRLFPAEDLQFITSWIEWADANQAVLSKCSPIATLGAPATGSIDGTACLDNGKGEGFVFLFNPSMLHLSVSLVLDESLGLQNSTVVAAGRGGDDSEIVDTWTVTEIYPRKNVSLGTWRCGV